MTNIIKKETMHDIKLGTEDGNSVRELIGKWVPEN